MWFIASLLTACTSVGAEAPPVTSAWGAIIEIGQAEQLDAPALWATESRLTAAWIGADDTGIHQDMRTIDANGMSDVVVLPLPPKNPYDQKIFSTGSNSAILWLDSDEAGETRLYGAVITPELRVERGPTVISMEATWRYTTVPNSDGSMWVISSGGLAFEPGLYARYIDPQGRPRLEREALIATDANWPTTATTNQGITYLFWIRPSDEQVLQATFNEGRIEELRSITQNVPLNPGDQIISFDAGLDHTHTYLIWNVKRRTGAMETWLASAPIDTPDWQQPKQFGIEVSAALFETGFNSGKAQSADMGEAWVRWGSMIEGQFETMAVAGLLHSGKLGIIYLRGGVVVGVQEIVPVSRLIGLPLLRTDRDQFLYLAWSEPGNDRQASLKLTTTRNQ